ncbi:hypothetical protein Dimus_031919 [Dionaea muscipula]
MFAMAKTKDTASTSSKSSKKTKSPQKSTATPKISHQDEGDKEEEEKELQVRGRRRLRKAASALVTAAVESEETLSVVPKVASDSDVEKEQQPKKRQQKQSMRIGPAIKRARTDKEKSPLVEKEIKKAKGANEGGSGSPILEQINQQVDELLARPFVSEAADKEWEDIRDYGGQGDVEEMPQMDEVEGSERKRRGDVGPSSSKRKERSLFAPRRLRLPLASTVRRCWDSLMGAASHTTIRSIRGLPLKHKCAVLCRNMVESALLTGDVIYSLKNALEREVKELKVELDSAFEISSEIKADVDMVMEENKTLEEKNEELEKKHEEMKSALEKEKSKGQTLESKIKELQVALQKEK